MINNPEIAKAIWKRQYDTDFALLDRPQEQIEFLKDLLLKNKENVIEAEKLPQFVPSDGQLTNQINDEFAPHKPTKKEWMKRWDEVNKELVLPVIMNQNHLSILEAIRTPGLKLCTMMKMEFHYYKYLNISNVLVEIMFPENNFLFQDQGLAQ